MDTSISRAEHEEFCKRVADENHRQNRRIEILEKSVQQQTALTISVEKLATNMENMLREQESQGDRLEALEERDGEMWRKAMVYVVTAVIGGLVGYILRQLGF